LRVHKVIDPDARKHSDGKGGFPVLILHGLFQSSGSFITSEERSLAFWLAKQGGYQVYLGNGRGVFGMGHRNLKRSDPRFWDWTIRELAMYDLPAMVDHVLAQTGYSKLAFIGHSQGNGLTFISLSLGMCPDLGRKMSLFVALAPAVYAGPLTQGFPFAQLGKIEWPLWKKLFGVLDFIPLMRYAADSNLIPAKVFATLG
jgi:lysosomal acid lipase/cholesteryl ester hydrolase